MVLSDLWEVCDVEISFVLSVLVKKYVSVRAMLSVHKTLKVVSFGVYTRFVCLAFPEDEQDLLHCKE